MTADPHHHVLDIYGTHLHGATSVEQWKKIRRQVKSLRKKPAAAGFSSFDTLRMPGGLTQGHLTLYVDVAIHGGDTSSLVDTCAHEAAHGASMILDHAGATYDGTSEPHAYLVGWLTTWLWDLCTKDTQ